jgi:MSHA biogenesis protein MshL
VTFNSFFSGISLDVTPHITDANEVTLHIHPTISVVTDDTRAFNLGTAGGNVSYPLAKSSVRESDSMVKAKNRETIVIGGLMQNQESQLEQGIPFFKDLPGIGRFFKHTVQVTQKKELVILLRPTIVGEDASTEDIDSSLERVQKLHEEIVKDKTRWDHLLR